MLKEQTKKFTKFLFKTDSTLFLIILLISLTSALALPSILPPLDRTPAAEPHVSIGCDRVIWNGDSLELLATIRDIENPQYQWIIDGENSTGAINFDMGEHMGEHLVILLHCL